MRLNYLLLIILFGFVLRLAFISDFPPSLNWDEVSLGYNAYSLLKTGKDEWGIALPAIFRAYGDFKLPGYIYADVPFISLGLNSLSVRLPSIISGTLLILISYILSKKLLSSAYSLLPPLLLAISPWSLFLSRVAVEANLGIMLFTLGVTLLIPRRLSLGILFLGISAWTYNSFRIFAPMFLVSYAIFIKPKINIIHASLFIILFTPIAIQLFSPSGQARYKWLTLLDEGAIARINELRQRPGGRLVYNKVTYLAYRFSANYLNHFNPKFLFITGGSQYQFNIPNHGLLYLVALPFFYLGLILAMKQFNNVTILLLWLLLAPIPGSLTRDAPHTLRAITMLPAVVILTSLGVSYFYKYKKLIFVFLLLSTMNYLLLTSNYRSSYSWSWQYGYHEAVQFIKDNYSKYDQIIFSKYYGEPHEFVAFYWPWNPADFQKNKQWDYHADWYWVNSLDKINFVVDREMLSTVENIPPDQKTLIISDPKFPVPGRDLKTINFLDNQPAFIIKEL